MTGVRTDASTAASSGSVEIKPRLALPGEDKVSMVTVSVLPELWVEPGPRWWRLAAGGAGAALGRRRGVDRVAAFAAGGAGISARRRHSWPQASAQERSPEGRRPWRLASSAKLTISLSMAVSMGMRMVCLALVDPVEGIQFLVLVGLKLLRGSSGDPSARCAE